MYAYTIITHGVVYSVVCLVSLALARLARQGGQSVACMLLPLINTLYRNIALELRKIWGFGHDGVYRKLIMFSFVQWTIVIIVHCNSVCVWVSN